jgi:uncharacterized membrane protein YfcA
MILETLQQYILPVLFFTGLIAGLVDAIAGGGGLITVPMLLSLGVPPHIALGTNKLQSTFGTAIATFHFYRRGLLKPQRLLFGLLCSFIASFLGALTSQLVNNAILNKLIPILLLLVLIYTIFSPRIGLQDGPPKMNEMVFYLMIGSLLGFYDGFFGPGTGSFWVFLLVFFLGQSLLKANAHTKAFNLNTNIAALLCFAIGNNIDYTLGFFMAAGQLIGGRLGAELAVRKGAILIRPVFITVVAATIAALIYKNM